MICAATPRIEKSARAYSANEKIGNHGLHILNFGYASASERVTEDDVHDNRCLLQIGLAFFGCDDDFLQGQAIRFGG